MVDIRSLILDFPVTLLAAANLLAAGGAAAGQSVESGDCELAFVVGDAEPRPT